MEKTSFVVILRLILVVVVTQLFYDISSPSLAGYPALHEYAKTDQRQDEVICGDASGRSQQEGERCNPLCENFDFNGEKCVPASGCSGTNRTFYTDNVTSEDYRVCSK